MKIILDLCGGTGAWAEPYEEAGYDVRVITLPEYDVRTYNPPENVYGILAAPPCTEFSIAKSYKLTRDFEAGLEIVRACEKIINRSRPTFFAIENPTGYLRQYLGKPHFNFQPWEFGDPWTKRTDIWGKFNIPKKEYLEWEDVPKLPLYIRPGRKKPSMASLHKSAQTKIPQFKQFNIDTDAAFRSITPPGFAKAFFNANK